MDEPIKYTSVDIERYLNHQMTKEEMHAFEKTMMDNLFLADALEGYRNADAKVTSLHLKEIATQIQEQKEENTILPLAQKNNNWWSVAAIVLLIAGIGSIYYFNSLKNDATTNMAANNISLPIADSIGPEVKPIGTPQLFSNKKELALAKNNTTPIIKQPQKKEALSLAATSTPIDSSSASMASNQSIVALKAVVGKSLTEAASQVKMRKTEQEVRNHETHEFNGKVIDAAGAPLAFATVSSKKGVGAVTDLNGNFSLKTTDSILEVSIASLGYMPVTTRINSNLKQRIKLSENSKDLSEVVVTAMGRKKKFGVAIDKNEYLNKETGYKPVKGWKHFNNYLLKNINGYRDAAKEYMSSDVEIKFEVDTNGKPINIEVVETNDELNANKAIELLKMGPLWKKAKPATKAQLLISF